MYMRAPHDHAEWLVERVAKEARWKENRGKGKSAKRKNPDTPVTAKKGTLRLKNTFKSALTTKMFVSDAEANEFVETLMTEIEKDDTEEDETSDADSKD